MPDDRNSIAKLTVEPRGLPETGGLLSSGASSRIVLKTAALALAYCATGGLGLLLAIPPGYATAVWPPSGIALAGILWWGPRVWPGVWVGSFLLNAWVSLTGTSPGVGVGLAVAASIAVGSSLQALLGAFLLQKWVGVSKLFQSGPAVLAFAGIEALCCFLAPSWGVATLGIAGLVDLAGYTDSWTAWWDSWTTWWFGDLIGVLVFAPVLLTWRLPRHPDRRPWHSIEAVASLTLLTASTLIAFFGPSLWGGSAYPLSFLPLSCLVWIAVRSNPGGVALATCLVSVIAVTATSMGTGPFAQSATSESLLLLQGFTGLTTMTALTLSASITGHSQSEASLRRLSAELQQLALTDELTGIRNRRGFLFLANQAWMLARRTGSKCLLVYFDVDGLKHVNDTHGHAVGDTLIVDAARVLTRVFRESDVIARLGGDEFAVLALVENTETAAAVSRRLRARIGDLNREKGRAVPLSMSFGIEELPSTDEISLEVLISRADRAMYGRKRAQAPPPPRFQPNPSA